ncbi:MAG: Heavy-metal-associated domain [Chthoniobacter sp.]|jgi:Cu+-exporting ATPase|nr:Heavy-metal-associated domain [Chthoniobacter sp.]
MKTLQLKLTGLHCGACIARTTKALATVPGGISAQVDQDAAKVEFAGDEPEAFLQAVQAAGYAAEFVH